MSILIESVSVTPNTVATGQQFLLSVKIQETTFGRLKSWTHRQLSRFTHWALGRELLK